MRAINPATGQRISDYPDDEPASVERKLARAAAVYEAWRTEPVEQRGRLMSRAADVLKERRAELAKLMTEEMGKPITAAEAEVDKCAANCSYYAEHAREMLAVEQVATDASRSYVRYDPLGVILAVMPWNFPFWQVFRFAAPALMAGNVGVLKHASNVPGCALAIESVFREAGFAEGCFTTLLVSGKVAEELIDRLEVRAVTLTGSEAAGQAIASRAGRAIKKCVLELGGSDPFIVLGDVEVVATARAAAGARCVNSGQSCIAAKRFIVEESIAERFEEALAAAMSGLRVGDPMDRRTEVGPMAREDLVEELDGQVKRSVEQGARLLAGGRRLEGRGWYYEPTVLTGVRPGMAAFEEETFGPVAAVVRAKGVEEMLELANRSRYGLGASIWTRDIGLAERMAGQIEAGSVFINGAVKSDPRLPFGGVKRSGYGRELSAAGIREFTNIKSLWIK